MIPVFAVARIELIDLRGSTMRRHMLTKTACRLSIVINMGPYISLKALYRSSSGRDMFTILAKGRSFDVGGHLLFTTLS